MSETRSDFIRTNSGALVSIDKNSVVNYKRAREVQREKNHKILYLENQINIMESKMSSIEGILSKLLEDKQNST
jgi:hypothetical protein